MELSVVLPLRLSVDEVRVEWLYNNLQRLTDKFELILVVSELARKDIHDKVIQISRTFPKIEYTVSKGMASSDFYIAGEYYCSYSTVILLDGQGVKQSIDLYDMLEPYIRGEVKSCFLLYESNNAEEPFGVVLPKESLRLHLDYTCAVSDKELLCQLGMLFYYLADTYRVNSKSSMFQLYKATLMPKGIRKWRMLWAVHLARREYREEICAKEKQMESEYSGSD